MPVTNSTIRFTTALVQADTIELPKNASGQLPSRAAAMVEGTINGFPFRSTLQSHSLQLSKALQKAACVAAGATAIVEITRIGEEPEPRLPIELHKALASSPKAQATWLDTTPIARRDWILWITSARQPETRLSRIEKACDMLASGKRRVCCFGGLNWLTKDHPSVETWLPLPKAKKDSSPSQPSRRKILA